MVRETQGCRRWSNSSHAILNFYKFYVLDVLYLPLGNLVKGWSAKRCMLVIGVITNKCVICKVKDMYWFGPRVYQMSLLNIDTTNTFNYIIMLSGSLYVLAC